MSTPAVEIHELTKDFSIGLRGVRLRAVEKLSLDVPEGSIFGLLGPNGSGKSTTLKVILGLLEPTEGRCRIFGEPSHHIQARRQVGFLPEAPYFYRYLSGQEMVRFYARISGVPKGEIQDRTDEVIRLVGMEGAASRRVGTYSKGMLQRIGLAQALVHDPRLVILDEPTAGVDPIGSSAIAEIVRSLKSRGKTVLLCSHLLAQVEDICDEVAILNRGQHVLSGSVDELLQARDLRSLLVRGYDETRHAELQSWLAKQGLALEEVAFPRISLDRLFLQKVGGTTGGAAGLVPGDNLANDKAPAESARESAPDPESTEERS
ncbi:MAG: ABC transporter ATP-binding protein [Opitutales bacterium]